MQRKLKKIFVCKIFVVPVSKDRSLNRLFQKAITEVNSVIFKKQFLIQNETNINYTYKAKNMQRWLRLRKIKADCERQQLW